MARARRAPLPGAAEGRPCESRYRPALRAAAAGVTLVTRRVRHGTPPVRHGTPPVPPGPADRLCLRGGLRSGGIAGVAEITAAVGRGSSPAGRGLWDG